MRRRRKKIIIVIGSISGLWHYPCNVCRIWRRKPCGFVAGSFQDIPYKYRQGIMIVFAFFYDRSQIQIGTILYQVIYSFCVDLFADAHVYGAHMWVNVLIMLLGVLLFAVGTGFYTAVLLRRGSYEAITFSLAEKNSWQIKTVRMIQGFVMVIAGVLLGGKFGVCTIVTILISEPMIQLTTAKTKELF